MTQVSHAIVCVLVQCLVLLYQFVLLCSCVCFLAFSLIVFLSVLVPRLNQCVHMDLGFLVLQQYPILRNLLSYYDDSF